MRYSIHSRGRLLLSASRFLASMRCNNPHLINGCSIYWIFLLLPFLGLTACVSGPVKESDSQQQNALDLKRYELSLIDQYVGKRPSAVGLWTLPEVEHHMTTLMGDEKYMELLFLMQEATPLKKERVVYSIGVLPDDAIQALGIVMFDLANNRVYAELIYPTVREVFTSGDFIYLPSEVLSRRAAFGVEHPEQVSREYPRAFSGVIACADCDGISFRIHLDPIAGRFLMYKGIIKGHGEVIRKFSGKYTATIVSQNQEEILEMIPDQQNLEPHRFRVVNNASLVLLNPAQPN